MVTGDPQYQHILYSNPPGVFLPTLQAAFTAAVKRLLGPVLCFLTLSLLAILLLQ
jgi:hypothetical protein